MDREQAQKHILFWKIVLWVFLAISLCVSYFYFIDTTSTKSKWVGLFSGAISILLASFKGVENSFYCIKDEIFSKISKYFLNGTNTYFKRLLIVGSILVLVLSLIFLKAISSSFVISFLTGSSFAFLGAYITYYVTSVNVVRFLQYRNEDISIIEKQIFNSSTMVSFATVGIAIVPLVILFHMTKDYQTINGFAFGVALVALLNNVSYIICSQSARSADDILCHQIAKFPRSDKRNPLLLLNGLTKNILKTSVMTSDFFAAFSLVLIAAMSLGDQFFSLMGTFLPIPISAAGIFSSVATILIADFIKIKKTSLRFLVLVILSNLIFISFCYCMIKSWLPDYMDLTIPLAMGSFGALAFCFTHFNFIFPTHRPPQNITHAAMSGFEQTFRQILKEGFGGVVSPAVIIALGIAVSFLCVNGMNEPSVGLYGIVLFVLGIISSSAILCSIGIFSNITQTPDSLLDFYYENTTIKRQNLVEMFEETNGNINALGKNYINYVSIFSSIVVLIAYSILAELLEVDIINPFVLSSLFVGAAIPYMFSSFVIRGCIKVGKKLVLEVEKHLLIIPQIMRYEVRPDYSKMISTAAIDSLLQVIIALGFVLLVFLIIGKCLNVDALFGFAFGAVISSFGLMFLLVALFNLATSAQKYFRTQYNYKKKQDEYDSIISNKVIFSTYEAIILPALNILIKFIAILTMALVPMFI